MSDLKQQETAAIRALLQAEINGQTSTITVGPFSLFCLISAIQLALRHPKMGGAVRENLTELLAYLKIPFRGTSVAFLVEAGMDPANDVEVTL